MMIVMVLFTVVKNSETDAETIGTLLWQHHVSNSDNTLKNVILRQNVQEIVQYLILNNNTPHYALNLYMLHNS